jgi:hypothetical protein
MTDGGPVTDEILRGLALLAVAQVEAGANPREAVRLLWPLLTRYGLATAAGLRQVAEAVAFVPEPVDRSDGWWLATHEVMAVLEDSAASLAS